MTALTKHIFQMANVSRFVGNNLSSDYSIGEHSFRVAFLAMLIADQYNLENPDNPINVEVIMRKGLFHDIEETQTGDIPSPVKQYGNLREELRSASEKIMENSILPKSPRPEYYKKLWVEDKDGDTGEVIKVADKLEGLLVCYYEIKRGNHYINEALISHVNWFDSGEGKDLLKKYTYALNEFNEVKDYLSNLNKESLFEKFQNLFKK